ncbi:hypothetical protein IF1G_01434 [Cordyceps javanica]|uniref:Uncharacterized protein n=1 Tax=Cordyceps javanica TaxID=43265 RepID=A0A545WAT9_9HYPO|nr:hypothetical protein IF1G_01434 [Cordyceps javanica]TQW11104.1 hypothetical protein IF2G_02046 [Cordyceps javanica]
MAPSASKANYKSYEAQARLVRAIVAAHPNTKWNYKEIAACYGSDMTEHALNHRFRHIRAQTEIITEGRKVDLDVKNLTVDESSLPKTVGAVDKKNIAKYFGQSTADGIQFQFRTIKKDADKMRATADSGGDPSSCLDLSSGSGPAFTPTTTPKTNRSRNINTPTTGGSTVKRGRTAPTVVKIESDDDDDDSESTHNWSEMEATPSKRPRKLDAIAATPGQMNGTPSRLAAARASATIATTSAQLQTSESEGETPMRPVALPINRLPTHSRNGVANGARPALSFATTTTAAPTTTSLFGNVTPFQPSASRSLPSSSSLPASNNAFRSTGTDAYLGSTGSHDSFSLPAADSAFYDDDDAIEGEC